MKKAAFVRQAWHTLAMHDAAQIEHSLDTAIYLHTQVPASRGMAKGLRASHGLGGSHSTESGGPLPAAAAVQAQQARCMSCCPDEHHIQKAAGPPLAHTQFITFEKYPLTLEPADPYPPHPACSSLLARPLLRQQRTLRWCLPPTQPTHLPTTEQWWERHSVRQAFPAHSALGERRGCACGQPWLWGPAGTMTTIGGKEQQQQLISDMQAQQQRVLNSSRTTQAGAPGLLSQAFI
eukprot:1161702-Pelagomonas_calceolata.AAC.6